MCIANVKKENIRFSRFVALMPCENLAYSDSLDHVRRLAFDSTVVRALDDRWHFRSRQLMSEANVVLLSFLMVVACWIGGVAVLRFRPRSVRS